MQQHYYGNLALNEMKGLGTPSSSLTHLNNLLTTGPVERGIYVASGGSEFLPRIQEGLVDLLWRYSLRSSGEGFPEENANGIPRFSRRVSQIGQIIWVDSGNRFDPYQISVMARQRGLDPSRILRAIKVGRPFTAFQYQQMLEKVPNPALLACPEEDSSELPSVFSRSAAVVSNGRVLSEFRSPNSVWWTPLVVISDLMGLFYDPELPEGDLHRAFHEFLVRLNHLKSRAIVLAVLREHDVPAHRKHLLPEVLRLTRRLQTRAEN